MYQYLKSILLKTLFIIVLAGGTLSHHTFAQSIKSVYKLLEKKEFEKLHAKLDKSIEKDSASAPTYYFYSLYFLDTTNVLHYDVDSSYQYLKKGELIYHQTDGKSKTQWIKGGLTDMVFYKQQRKIEAIAYDSALSQLTEEAFITYLQKYPEAEQQDGAIEKRDSIAFSTAEKEDTYTSYKLFLDKYPEAIQYSMAEERYNVLLYRNKTIGGSKQELAKFLKEHPNSPFYKETEYRLYEIYREKHQLSDYQQFVQDQPINSFALEAWEWVWHLTLDKNAFFQDYPLAPKLDHFHQLSEADTALFYPYFSNESKQFGFFDYTGETKIGSIAPSVPEDYLCGAIQEQFLLFYDSNQLGAINKLGELIIPANYDDIESLDQGTLLVWKDDVCGIMSMSGKKMVDTIYDDIYPLKNGLLKAQKKGKWGIISYYDQEMYPFVADEILQAGYSELFIKEKGKYKMLPYQVIWEGRADEYTDDQIISIEKMPRGFIRLLDKDSLSTLVNPYGKKIIPSDKHQITFSEHGWVVEKDSSFYIYNDEGRKLNEQPFQKVIEGKLCYAVKSKDKWGGIRFNGEVFLQPSYDTLYFLGNKGLGLVRDKQQFLYFEGNEDLVDFSGYQDIRIQWGNVVQHDTLRNIPHIIARNPKRKSQYIIMNAQGEKVMQSSYDNIDILGEEVIEVQRRNKRGIFTLDNQALTKIAYEGIAKGDKAGYYSLFLNAKFGLLNAHKNWVLPTEFDKLLKPYGASDSLFIGIKGRFGIVNQNNETKAPFIFEDLQYWNDSVALVRHENKWKLYHFKSNYYLPETFDTFEWVRNSIEERIIITYRSSGYGVLSSKRGRVIVEEFSDIINLGSAEKPLFFVERAISQVGLYVILYFDETGKLLREGILREDAYQKLICPDY